MTVREVTLRRLNRHTSGVIGGVREGERIVISEIGRYLHGRHH